MNLEHCPDSPDLDLWASLPEPLPRSPSPRILMTTDYNEDQSSKKHVWELSRVSGEDKLTESLQPLESQLLSPMNACCPTTRNKLPIKNTSRSSTAMNMSCVQQAQKLERLDRGLAMLRQKLTLATRVHKNSKSRRKSERPKKGLSSLLDRLSIPETRERGEQSSQRKEIQRRNRPMFVQTTHPALITRLTSPPPPPPSLLSRLTDCPFRHIAESESNSISTISNEPRTSLKWKEHPSTSDEQTTCSTTGPVTFGSGRDQRRLLKQGLTRFLRRASFEGQRARGSLKGFFKGHGCWGLPQRVFSNSRLRKTFQGVCKGAYTQE